MAEHIAADSCAVSQTVTPRPPCAQRHRCPGCGAALGRQGYSATMWQRVRRARFDPRTEDLLLQRFCGGHLLVLR